MLTDAELAALVQEKLHEDPGFMPPTLAQNLGVPLGRLLAALPQAMRSFACGSDAVAIWEAMSEWEKATFVISSPGAVLEISCRLPKGTCGANMYNLKDKESPLGGHLLMDKIASVCFVSKPARGRENHSVQFLDAEGERCFAVYLGRDEKREIIPAVREGFFALKARYSA